MILDYYKNSNLSPVKENGESNVSGMNVCVIHDYAHGFRSIVSSGKKPSELLMDAINVAKEEGDKRAAFKLVKLQEENHTEREIYAMLDFCGYHIALVSNQLFANSKEWRSIYGRE